MASKVAIIGGGIAGLTAGYLLRDRHDVTLYEKAERVGGNAYTLTTKSGDEIDVSVFFYSTASYPTFFELLSKLGDRFQPDRDTVASMAYFDLDTSATMSLNPREMIRLRPSMLRAGYAGLLTLRNIRTAFAMLRRGELEGRSVRDVLDLLPHRQSSARMMLLFPICLASSMSYGEVLDAPASFVFDKMRTHFGSQRRIRSWAPLRCRTREYIEALAESLGDRIRLGSQLRTVARGSDGVAVVLDDGSRQVFDHVIFACNADQALRLLESPTDEEKRLLGAWRYKEGRVVVHSDHSSFPAEKHWSMYDFLYTNRDGEIETSVNAAYRFQPGVSPGAPTIGTQHPNFEIRSELIEFDRVFRTPIFDDASVRTIPQIERLNGTRSTWYCGSHLGHGLHEDAVRSAVQIAVKLGADW